MRGSKRDVTRFIKRNAGWLLVGIGAVAAVLLIILVLVPGVQKGKQASDTAVPPAQTQQLPAEQAPVQDVELATDKDMLAGLTGEGDALQPQKPGDGSVKIGVTTIKESARDKAVLQGLEKLGTAAVAAGQLDDFFMYNAWGSENQQLQDIYTMINNGVSVVVVVDASAYNFGKISEIAESNGVKIVVYNTQETMGFAVNVKNMADPAAEFSQKMKEAGQNATYTLGASPAQLQAMKGNIEVKGSYEDMWDMIYQIRSSLEGEEPMQSAIVLDYNANDVLRSWLQRETVPQSVAGIGTVAFIKTWYALINGGLDVALPAETAAEDLPEGEQPPEPETVFVADEQGVFRGFASTSPGNVGDVLYTFAKNLAAGKTLPGENYVYEIDGYDIITNDNIAEYYQQVKDEDSGLVWSNVALGDIDGLFAG